MPVLRKVPMRFLRGVLLPGALGERSRRHDIPAALLRGLRGGVRSSGAALPPLRCVACEQAIGIRDSLTGSGEDTWHTRCWNAAEEPEKDRGGRSSMQMGMPTPKPMGAALELQPKVSTEVA